MTMRQGGSSAFVMMLLAKNLDIIIQTVAAPPDLLLAQLSEHRASCNLCGLRISGDRYKCVGGCPDFDTCADCFSITAHPIYHSFVRLAKSSDYIVAAKTK
ncbi:hypothetical protein B0H14DRAFT_2702781 [Mycena olivaceomarginata]|nr:hypothetical protein B0H14DRAFT_2702781 [Mycena olivaceomarginata]